MRMSGDLMTTSRTFPFSVEVKRNEGWSEVPLQAGKPSPVWAWWRQCQTAACECGQLPMLWFRHSREEWRVMLPFSFASIVPIRPPFMVWSQRALLGVDAGFHHPIVFLGPVVLSVNPAAILVAVPKGAS